MARVLRFKYIYSLRDPMRQIEMFNKEQQPVVTDEEVGDFIRELHQSTELGEEDEDMVRDSQGTSTGA